MFADQLPGALNVSLFLSIKQSCPFPVQKTSEHDLGTSVKECVYIEALKENQKPPGFYVLFLCSSFTRRIQPVVLVQMRGNS